MHDFAVVRRPPGGRRQIPSGRPRPRPRLLRWPEGVGPVEAGHSGQPPLHALPRALGSAPGVDVAKSSLQVLALQQLGPCVAHVLRLDVRVGVRAEEAGEEGGSHAGSQADGVDATHFSRAACRTRSPRRR